MWISLKAYLKDREDSILLRTERDAAVTQLRQQETTLAWFMHRLTQVEQERAKLIFTYTGVKVEAPAYEPAPDPAKEAMSLIQRNPLNSLPSFEDVGDEEAARLGIDWDDEGKIVFAQNKVTE